MVLRRAIYAILFYFPALLFSQQELGKEMRTIDSLIRAQNIPLAIDLVSVYLKECDEDCPKGLVARRDYLLGWKILQVGNADSALQITENWLPRLDWKKKTERSPFFSLTGLKGICQRKLGKLDAAYTTFSELLEIELQKEEIDSTVLLSIQINLANICIYQQKFHKAKVQLLQAKELALQMEGGNAMLLSNCYNSLSYISRSLNDPKQAIEYLRASIEMKEFEKDNSHIFLASSLFNLGILLHEEKRPDEALPYVRKAYGIWTGFSEKTHVNAALSEAILGQIFADLGQSDSALIFLKRAELAVQKNTATELTMGAVIHQNIGEGYMKLQDFNSAAHFLDEAMHRLGANPFEEIDFSKVTDHRALHFTFMSRAETYRHAMVKKEGEQADPVGMILEQDLLMYKYLQGGNGANGDRQLTTELAFPLFEAYLGFLSQHEVPSLEKAFELMELGKARLLSEKLQREEVPHFAGISDSISYLESHLESAIVSKEAEIEGMVQQGETFETVRLERELDKLKERQKTFLADLQRNHKAYFNMKYVQAPISLAEAQADIKADEALLSYFVGDSSVYLLLLRKASGKLQEIELDFPLRKWVGEMRAAMYSHDDMAARTAKVAQAHAQQYCLAAFALYDKLLRPIENELPLKVRIIPDGVLSFIPFEALLSSLPTEPQAFRQHAYLIHKYQFSYSISATLHHQLLASAEKPASESILVMAPSFSSGSKLKNLNHNSDEAVKIQQIMGGELLKDAAATGHEFKKRAADFRILHIATHAKSDDQNGDSSYIAFTPVSSASAPNFIYARDIYDIPLQAEMVVLSGCETGLGEWQPGEGIMGLNRACMYAGAKSTVTSLWKVDDASTSGLIGQFYQGLRDGLSKDAALREAKLHYLKTGSLGHPYYWASFISIGNMAPISFERSFYSPWLVVMLIPLLLVLGFLLINQKKKKAHSLK